MFAIVKVASNACNKLVAVDFDTCVGSDPSRTEDLVVKRRVSLTRNYFDSNDRYQSEYLIYNAFICEVIHINLHNDFQMTFLTVNSEFCTVNSKFLEQNQKSD